MKEIKIIRKGFTLIELMVVVAIIAILSAIITANFAAAKSKARDGQRISDVAQIQLALAGYFNQCDQYPTPDTSTGGSYIDAATLAQNGGCPSGISLSTFITKIPTPPAGTSQSGYYYIVGNFNGVPADYVLGTTLENNSSVSSESITSVPSDISNGSSGNYLVCDSGLHYCLSPK